MVITGDHGKCGGGSVGDLGDDGAVVAAGVGDSFSNVLLRTTALGWNKNAEFSTITGNKQLM